MFQRDGNLYCKSCFEKNEKEYDLISDYIRKHPNSTVLDIITETGVSLKSINCFVADGDISYVENRLTIGEDNQKSEAADKSTIKRSKFHIKR